MIFTALHKNLSIKKLLLALIQITTVIGTCFSSISYGAPIKSDVIIVTGDHGTLTKRIVESLQNVMPKSEIFVDQEKMTSPYKKGVYIAVGPAALKILLKKNIDSPTFVIFTSSLAYHSILETTQKSHNITAIYAEPSLANQLQLVAMLYQKSVKVAALISDKTNYIIPTLHQAANKNKIILHLEKLTEEDDLNRKLNHIADIPVLLAFPDSLAYRAENIPNILMTSYRHNQAVIGFTKDLVHAGALASVYSDIPDIIAHLREVLSDYETTGHLPAPQFPKYFNLAINDAVARSLNLVIDKRVRNFYKKPYTSE